MPSGVAGRLQAARRLGERAIQQHIVKPLRSAWFLRSSTATTPPLLFPSPLQCPQHPRRTPGEAGSTPREAGDGMPVQALRA